MCPTFATQYPSVVKSAIASFPSFKAICDLNVQHFPPNGYALYYASLGHGTSILETHEQLNAYMASYGDMHQVKLHDAYRKLFEDGSLRNKSVQVVDWGCGQALASCVLIDFIRENNVPVDINKFVLIEPSAVALKRGEHHIDAIYQRHPKPEVVSINSKADYLNTSLLSTDEGCIKLHLFSNLLDIGSLDMNRLVSSIKETQKGLNYFVCVSPINPLRLRTFYQQFEFSELLSTRNDQLKAQIFGICAMRRIFRMISRIEYIFKVNM